MARPDLAIRGNKYTELTEDDLEWGDTYVGFRRPPLPSMGNIRWVHCTGAGVVRYASRLMVSKLVSSKMSAPLPVWAQLTGTAAEGSSTVKNRVGVSAAD